MLLLTSILLFISVGIVLSYWGISQSSIGPIKDELVINALVTLFLSAPFFVFWPEKINLIFVGIFWGIIMVDIDHWSLVIAKIAGNGYVVPSRTILHSFVAQFLVIVVLIPFFWVEGKMEQKIWKNIPRASFGTLLISGYHAYMGVVANFLVDLRSGWDANIFWLITETNKGPLSPSQFVQFIAIFMFFTLIVGGSSRFLHLTFTKRSVRH